MVAEVGLLHFMFGDEESKVISSFERIWVQMIKKKKSCSLYK